MSRHFCACLGSPCLRQRTNRPQGEVSYDSFRRWWVRRTIAKEGGAQVSLASPRGRTLMGGGARRCRPTATQ
eukprot:COSAG01_NODE_1364_length_10563_cov_7.354931_10_plen_72_part_00